MRNVEELNYEKTSDGFPLNAEQIVRLTAAVLWEMRDATRRAGVRPEPYLAILARIAAATGVGVPEIDAARVDRDDRLNGAYRDGAPWPQPTPANGER